MSVLCPGCGRFHDTALLRKGGLVSCECGAIAGLDTVARASDEKVTARKKMRKLELMANRICALILNERYPYIDVAIEIENVRAAAERMFPGRGELFTMIYQSRFDRLREQFRNR